MHLSTHNWMRAEPLETTVRRIKQYGYSSIEISGEPTQYNTRDTFGFAMKATYGEVLGEGREIFKDPVTDDGTKKSAKGLIKIERENGSYILHDQVSWEEERQGELKEVFRDGKLLIDYTLAEIRSRLK